MSTISGKPAAAATGPGVGWQTWGNEAFAAAQRLDRPILLSIDAVWCYWCHEMDRTTYADPDVIQYLNDHFTPVRVDTDHRPDVNARYNVGGWPTTTFLTPHGGYIAGATYLPPDQFLAMLDEVRRAYSERKPELYEQGNDIRRQRREHAARVAAGQEPDASLVDGITRRGAGIYDPINGGFGTGPKFPSAPMLRLLLHRYRTTREPFFRVMLEKSLDAVVQGALRDQVDGGFFRFTMSGDWTDPQYEKMAEDNIALAGALMDSAIVLQLPDYLRHAGATVDYILAHLYDSQKAVVHGSQGTHSIGYFGESAHARANLNAPAADPHSYASVTAQASSLLFKAAWTLGRPELTDVAVAMLDRLADSASTGRLSHVDPGSGREPAADGDLLLDWSAFLIAALDGHDSVPAASERYRQAAEHAASVLSERFLDAQRGGFYDIEDTPDRPGYLAVREKPLAENVGAALGMMRLSHATFDPRFLHTAHHTLSAYVDANRDYGELAADYAIAVDRYLNPVVEVTVEGRPGSPDAAAMLAAAMTLDAPNLLVRLAIAENDDAPAQAHVCLDTVCYPPVSDPAELADAIANGGMAVASPFQNVLDLLG